MLLQRFHLPEGLATLVAVVQLYSTRVLLLVPVQRNFSGEFGWAHLARVWLLARMDTLVHC